MSLDPADIAVVTVATRADPLDPARRGFAWFLGSCRRVGITPVVLGQDRPWTGYRTKTDGLRAYLARPGIRPYFLWADALDSVFQFGLGYAAIAYELGGRPLLFSAEDTLWPEDPELAARLPRSPTRYKGPCSGVFMGRADVALRMLDEIEVPDTLPGDQRPIQEWIADHPEACAVDHDCRLAFNYAHAADDIRYDPGYVRLQSTGAGPGVLHGNGWADMRAAYLALGIEPEVPR